MTTLSPEQIAYAVEWWRSGNEWRRPILVGTFPTGTLRERWGGVDGNEVCLTDAAITLAKMAIALELANETAEACLFRLTGQHHGTEGFSEMRANKKELLG